MPGLLAFCGVVIHNRTNWKLYFDIIYFITVSKTSYIESCSGLISSFRVNDSSFLIMWVGAFESKPIESVYLVTSDLLNALEPQPRQQRQQQQQTVSK